MVKIFKKKLLLLSKIRNLPSKLKIFIYKVDSALLESGIEQLTLKNKK